ncbi:uncharacterized protein LOC129606911 [Condylostylus longicornis]|uniref:uncharacterized protein LOC129606911 n=1 Tax=Condylostylus longicornis TaxID=2530218 RepID=UPI00244DA573|nr:uncharacterized protein LOC129606911 [Condylostylus longicornis]
MISNVDYFEQFRRHVRDNKLARARNDESVSLLLSNFGNEAYDCSEKFFEQGIEFRDLASLNREDLQLFGIKDNCIQTEMLEIFSQLTKQDFSLDDIKNSSEAARYNSEIVDSAASYLNTMKLALTATNLKLKLKPSGDIVVDERNFASKFVLDALCELQHMTDEIEKELKNLEEICCDSLEHEKRKPGNAALYITFGTILALSMSIAFWKLR